jgi:toxin-antitoxin system PIN domain toxin
VILIDNNLLVYAVAKSAEFHVRSNSWLDDELTNGSKVGLPWHSLLGFVRVVSNRRAYPRGLSVPQAWQIVRGWLALGNVWIPQPTERHGDIIDDLIASTAVGMKDVMDLHLAALAIEHGLTLCSADTDFARYKSLRWLNPLD